ncbi:D-mannonate oxidoreductase [Pullulanibacillus camelliae]|uniref:D-mannonate oxidoreductase n=1 Tax=Pullulanibacillus camelliae TaxID=1707096 RepID=A0A8J2YKU3_9BACL|nr:SDR family oxidoreductase [Pullulanibacillus camelliae]GGE49254.1 D-mannonate oxidoreductase [Pullulanibacillus camelliae]
MMFNLTGKTAVIVGGTSTLGSAMAKGLAEYGANIALTGRNIAKLRDLEKEIEAFGVKVAAFQTDVTDELSMQQTATDIERWADGIDIVLNAPGVNSTTPFSELSMEEWDHIMNVNLRGVVLSCQIFSDYMMKRGKGGSIINISSVSSTLPLSKVFTYSASKAGINSITQYLARELAPHHIRVNAIIPGFFPAEQNRNILSEERVNAIMAHTPMQRFGEPEELQGVAIWLASEKASGFVTGELIRVDGGFGAMTI